MHEILSFLFRWRKWNRFDTFLLVAVFTMAAVGALLFGTYLAADSWFTKDQVAITKVSGHYHSPAKTEMQPVKSNHGTTYEPVDHPEAWMLYMDINGERLVYEVDGNTFGQIPDGHYARVRYHTGRFSGHLYVTDVEFSPP